MSLSALRRKSILIPSALVALVLVIGGVFWASSASADLSGSERDRVVAAARDAAGEGEVISAESSDRDPDDADAEDRLKAYEVEIRKADGSEVEVALDEDLEVVGQQRDGVDDDTVGGGREADARDADDRVLSATERTRAEKAATDAVGGGTATDADAGDDPGVAYEVDVRGSDGTEWNVDLDASYDVVSKRVDR